MSTSRGSCLLLINRASRSGRDSFDEATARLRRAGFTLDIPARPRYRTVARFGASHPPGQYRIVIRNEAGAELESVTITITE